MRLPGPVRAIEWKAFEESCGYLGLLDVTEIIILKNWPDWDNAWGVKITALWGNGAFSEGFSTALEPHIHI